MRLSEFTATMGVISVLWVVDMPIASAQACVVVNSPRYLLNSDQVDWSMRITTGGSCVHGLRFGTVVLQTVALVVPPQSGKVTLAGPGFRYTANPNFHGEDSFTIEVAGVANKIHGKSSVHVSVSILDPNSSGPEKASASPASPNTPSTPSATPQPNVGSRPAAQ